MQNIAYKDYINIDRLQNLQDELCRITGVSIYCIDREGGFLTEISGPVTKDMLKDDSYRMAIESALSRVEEGSLEEMAIEEVEDCDSRVAAIALGNEGNIIIYWVAIYKNSADDNMLFENTLDLLLDASKTMLSVHMSYFSAEAESRRSKYAELEMSRNLKTIEATTAIVQLLDDDDAVDSVVGKWLKILAKHLDVDTAEVISFLPGAEYMDIVSEWRKPDQVPFFEKNHMVPALQLLDVTKPLVISSDSGQVEYQQDMEKMNLRAVCIFPVFREKNGSGMVVALNHRGKNYNWTVSEIKFVNDAVKILHSFITRRIQKNSLASSFEALEMVLDNVGCAIYVSSKEDGKRLFANKKLKNTFYNELKDNSFLELIEDNSGVEDNDAIREIYSKAKDRWYDLVCKEISWVDGSLATIYSLYDVTEKKIYQRKIEQQAYTDFLTGLYNRMCCERDLARQIDEAEKKTNVGALMYLDLDDFKHINDGLGHQYGDVLLKAISSSLKNIDGIRNTCYRMGGDEFVIVVPPDYYPEFSRIVEDIKKIFQKPWFLKDADYYCTMSMGIVTFPDGGDSVPDLIKKADIAMYEAKKSGKNRVAFYKDGNDSNSGRRLDMERNMRDATADGYKEFEVYYQPIIDVEAGKTICTGAEALIRWNSESLGFIPPAEFIPLAEYLGLINPIGNYVLKKACEVCKNWNDNGHPEYKINVNLSVVQLLQTDIVEIIEQTLKDTKLIPSNLTLEVTESLAINDMERMKDILGRIKELGVKIALDDFGTGYSSLNHIREIPFDVIKVDQSFVKDLAEDAYSQSFVKMVAELGETIGVSICVEGIETKGQFNVLKDMKVKYIQGYLFDKPMKQNLFEEKYVEGLAKK